MHKTDKRKVISTQKFNLHFKKHLFRFLKIIFSFFCATSDFLHSILWPSATLGFDIFHTSVLCSVILVLKKSFSLLYIFFRSRRLYCELTTFTSVTQYLTLTIVLMTSGFGRYSSICLIQLGTYGRLC